jgi:DNA methylase
MAEEEAPLTPEEERLKQYFADEDEELLETLVKAVTNAGETVADFFCGGGTTAAPAQRLGRRWIACDQSRVAVAITADRLTRQVEEQTGTLLPVSDFTVEHWGIYETRRCPRLRRTSFALLFCVPLPIALFFLTKAASPTSVPGPVLRLRLNRSCTIFSGRIR